MCKNRVITRHSIYLTFNSHNGISLLLCAKMLLKNLVSFISQILTLHQFWLVIFCFLHQRENESYGIKTSMQKVFWRTLVNLAKYQTIKSDQELMTQFFSSICIFIRNVSFVPILFYFIKKLLIKSCRNALENFLSEININL